MGFVVDEELAKATPCHGYKDPETGELYVWSPGVIGMLSDDQEKLYCKGTITEVGTPKRIAEFKSAVNVCKAEIRKYPKGERLLPWLECMSKELRKRGIKL